MARGKSATRDLDKVRDKQVVADTSIAILLADAGYRGQVISVLRQLEKQGNDFYASELSLYELNKNSLANAQVTASARLLRKFRPIKITQPILIGAGTLLALMKKQKPDYKNKEHDIACDMIIGATVIENDNALLFTTNEKDFLPPCWEKIAEGRVVKKNKANGWSIMNWMIMKFNYTLMPAEFMSEGMIAKYHTHQETLALPT